MTITGDRPTLGGAGCNFQAHQWKACLSCLLCPSLAIYIFNLSLPRLRSMPPLHLQGAADRAGLESSAAVFSVDLGGASKRQIKGQTRTRRIYRWHLDLPDKPLSFSNDHSRKRCNSWYFSAALSAKRPNEEYTTHRSVNGLPRVIIIVMYLAHLPQHDRNLSIFLSWHPQTISHR